jgi:hypothetical protein
MGEVGSTSDRAQDKPWQVDDARLARALRELLRRNGKTIVAAARDAGVSRRMVRRLLREGAGDMPVNVVRVVFDSLGARARVSVWWQGADLDRLMDQDHAAVVERVVGVLRGLGWSVLTEVTFSEYGERGSIDVLAFHAATRTLLVVEVKASWGSVEETNRSLDVKVRLASKIGLDRFGVKPLFVGRLLVFPNESTHRRIAARHRETLASAYPARGREVRQWLRKPSGPLAGLWFLSKRPDLAPDDTADVGRAATPAKG